jgi:hypothetical protein
MVAFGAIKQLFPKVGDIPLTGKMIGIMAPSVSPKGGGYRGDWFEDYEIFFWAKHWYCYLASLATVVY